MQLMAIFYSIIYIQYGAYTHHIIIGHSCVEYKEEVFVMIVYDRLWITLKKKKNLQSITRKWQMVTDCQTP